MVLGVRVTEPWWRIIMVLGVRVGAWEVNLGHINGRIISMKDKDIQKES
jgi:hypothetical protein